MVLQNKHKLNFQNKTQISQGLQRIEPLVTLLFNGNVWSTLTEKSVQPLCATSCNLYRCKRLQLCTFKPRENAVINSRRHKENVRKNKGFTKKLQRKTSHFPHIFSTVFRHEYSSIILFPYQKAGQSWDKSGTKIMQKIEKKRKRSIRPLLSSYKPFSTKGI